MKQPLLIQKNSVESYLQVAIGYSEREFERYIKEAQEFDLKPLLSDQFYYELLENMRTEPYLTVIFGSKYEYEGRTYYHDGLEAVISYFAYARFVLKSNAVSTSHGIVNKKSPNSEPISQAEKKDMYYSHRQDANTLLKDVVKYMNHHNINYNGQNCSNESVGGDIITRAPQW